MISILPTSTILLILAGGIVYSLGSFIHTRIGWPFQNAVWHGMVIMAAGLHLVAIAQVITLPAGP